jgi:hypothetical protein
MKRLNRASGDRGSDARQKAVLVGILVAIAGTAVPLQAAFTPITICNPTVSAPAGSLINTPGDYGVAAELNVASGDCILITTSGVSLKLNGHSIVGSGTGRGVNVTPPSGRVDHVGIQGPGLVAGFTYGILINNADYSQVALVILLKNVLGLTATNVNYLTVGSNVIGRSVNDGLVLSGYSSVIAWNDASGNGTGSGGGSGIIADGGGNTVNNNTANGNKAVGIIIANAARVYGNVTNGNGQTGITVEGTGIQVFSNSSSAANGLVDLYDFNATCNGNLWSNSVFVTRNAECIH